MQPATVSIRPKSLTNLIYRSQDSGYGLGTFGSDRYSAEEVAEAVRGAVSVGYRHIDCAAVYGNEHLIGEVLRELMQAGIKGRIVDYLKAME